MRNEFLPDDLLWHEGHASEVALSAMADGETAIVTSALTAHVDACASCTHRLGDAALFSAGLTSAVGAMGPLTRLAPAPALSAAPVSARRRAPLPLPMMAAAMVIALIGAAPTLLQLPTRMSGILLALLHSLPTVSHSGVQLMRSGLGPFGVVLTFVSALLLVMVSVGLTRLLPRPVTESSR